ncbi:Hsp70 nucleotide exchange factor FES1 [Cryphonectria parasitica EP155]|uniref:Hsp70 nucleotide exchange factor FES1 n=1 Tax=Cryphonectria parasitica (strain ATCC 38755 / EP155) TaxID=660469 RepID=A0A9P4YE07_CRYP1|nr:Hsp70 nucleotide exchange factor FES1 [Cryphonectria parasitica EP155]KAF3771248.1 Hsp70 nucleotide exchange factor FES1 [Cryphonectria parasitica EP155]
MDKNLNELLKWSIEAQTASEDRTGNAQPTTQLTPEVLASLLGGPSDAELMVQSMQVITAPDPSIPLDDRLTAFDNFEQLIESLDNANNMVTLKLWPPLLSMLAHDEAELRRYAAWCIGTAVQNNEKSQAGLLDAGGLPGLVDMATKPAEKEAVRRKAIYALSSACRNYQPAMDIVAAELEKKGTRKEVDGKVDATNMDAVDEVMNGLKNKIKEDAANAAA